MDAVMSQELSAHAGGVSADGSFYCVDEYYGRYCRCSLRSAHQTGWKKMTRIKRLKKNKQGVIGLTGVLLTMMSGLVGPLLVEKPAGFTTDILMPPSAVHPFGTDNLGLDILGELVWGAQTSIYISVTAVLLATAIGVIAGLICGYEEGLGAEAIDFFVDIVMTLPVLPLSIIAAACSEPPLGSWLLSWGFLDGRRSFALQET